MFIIVFGGLYSIAYKCTDNPDTSPNYIKTDTVKVEKIQQVQPINNNYPTKVIIQTVIDTSRRNRAEKETIITGVKVDTKHNEISIQKIDTAGKVTEEVHRIEEGSTAVIDNKNFEEKKKTKVGKFLQKSKKIILRGLQIAGGAAIVYVAVKNL